MPTRAPLTQISGRPRDVKTMHVAGGVAGILACPAGTIKVGDEIVSVSRFTTATFVPGTDLTAEFISPVTVADQISNVGGTSTAGQLLLVVYATRNSRQ
jgi:hypothetical protein